MRSILDTINEHISDVNQVLTKSLPKKIASDLSQLEPLDVRYSVYVKKLFDEVFVEIEKLQKSKYIIETNEFIWAVEDYFDKKSTGLHYSIIKTYLEVN